jgi:hypothetical protein
MKTTFRVLIAILSSLLMVVFLSFASIALLDEAYPPINALISVLFGFLIYREIKKYQQGKIVEPKESYENSQDSVNNPEVLKQLIEKYTKKE